MSASTKRSAASVAGNLANILFAVIIILQLLLAVGILPITMAWGGRQPVLTTGLRLASLAAVAILVFFAYMNPPSCRTPRRHSPIENDQGPVLADNSLSGTKHVRQLGFTKHRGENYFWDNFIVVNAIMSCGITIKTTTGAHRQPDMTLSQILPL